jgi:hypothetical protein
MLNPLEQLAQAGSRYDGDHGVSGEEVTLFARVRADEESDAPKWEKDQIECRESQRAPEESPDGLCVE